MHERFDLRDRVRLEALWDAYPKIDGRPLHVSRDVFLRAITMVSSCLGNPAWLVYYRGVVGPYRDARTQLLLKLSQIVSLALDLEELSKRSNFGALLEGFANPTQFLDTVFEARAASYFSRLAAVTDMVISPEVVANGRRGHPEFKLVTGRVCCSLNANDRTCMFKMRSCASRISLVRFRLEWKWRTGQTTCALSSP